ncbi:MAG: hypothetical protein KA257_05925 [Opitutaceae bacterium]|nr:hypothetical protein [Opitutaceae bacterium]
MNKSPLCFLLALGLASAFLGVRADGISQNPTEAAPTGERALLATGLAKLGIDATHAIVIADAPDLVERTAAEVLQKFLRRGGLEVKIVPASGAAAGKRFLLGREINQPEIRRLGENGKLNIHDVSAEDDGFHLKRIGEDIVVAGANPRGVLYGVYAFEDFVEAGATETLDVRKVPYFRQRGSGPVYSFNRYVNLATEDFPEGKAIYLSRLGINQLTDQGVGASLHDFVDSDVFPFQRSVAEVNSLQPRPPDFRRKVKAMAALCRKYGIDQYVFLSEPVLPRDAARLDQYPPEALGAVQRPWGGDKDGRDVTLCVSSPIVQAHLRNMMEKFAREYPDVKGVIFYNMDMSHWICTPALCPRCRAVCTDSPADVYNPWETQAKLVTLLAEAAHAGNPAFDFRLWGAVHYHGERFDKMIHAARGYNSLLSGWSGSDRCVMVPDSARPDPAFLTTLQVAADRGVPAHVAFEFNNLETVARSLPFPFHVTDALKKFKAWGVRNTTEIFGTVAEHNSINALVTREFQWDPDQDPAGVLAELARRQFGAKAGPRMYDAWQEVERAFDAWNDFQFGPLDGSQFYFSIGTTAALLRALVPTDLGDYGNLGIMTKVEPWRAQGYQRFKGQAFAQAMGRMNIHLARAAARAGDAVAEASAGERVGLWYCENPEGRPTQRQYAELNQASIALASELCRQRNAIVRAYHLHTGIESARAADDAPAAHESEDALFALVREDIAAQQRFINLLGEFARREPCYVRTSLTRREIDELVILTEGKIRKMRAFLADKAEERRE